MAADGDRPAVTAPPRQLEIAIALTQMELDAATRLDSAFRAALMLGCAERVVPVGSCRIFPGTPQEIRAALANHPAVDDAVLVASEPQMQETSPRRPSTVS